MVAVDMGYGHERAAYSLKELSAGKVIIANNYQGIPKSDRNIWERSRRFYEKISQLKPLPIVGDIIFEAMDKLQQIPDFYPQRDLSRSTVQLKQIYAMIRKHDYGRDMVRRLREHPLPLVTTFFLPAFFAEEFDYPEEIYCLATDSDISRTWAGLEPRSSRIKFFAPNARVVERLRLYGVRSENIFLTGFPLPKEAVGGVDPKVIKKDLLARLCNLDPNGYFLKRYQPTLKAHLGRQYCNPKSHRPLTLTFAVGGAGAQKRLGLVVVKSLKEMIRRKKIIVQLVAGVRPEVASYFRAELRKLKFSAAEIRDSVKVLHYKTRAEYFSAFPDVIRKTDILWTKPSELSFYTGLGLPIVMAPPIGSQEEFNRYWLIQMGGGVDQLDPKHTDEWLTDWIESGGLARMAWNGYLEAPTHGAFRIESIITGKKVDLPRLPFIV